MEDKSNSRTKELQRDDLNNDLGDGPLFAGPHLNSDEINSKYFSKEFNQGLQHLSFLTTNSNLKSLRKLEQTTSFNNVTEDTLRKDQRSSQAFWKALNKGFQNFEKINKNISPLIERAKTVNLLHSELYSWNTVLRHLVSMPSLSVFNTSQVLCHEKGTTNVISYSLGSENQIKESKTSIESFNKVFNQIKKSKGRQFSQTQLTIPEFEFTGSFLASIFQLKTHNVLFLLSDNSFFPISDEAIDEFNRLTKQIQIVLSKVIDKDLFDSKISNLYRVFELLPIPVSIHGPLGNIVFQNDLFKNLNTNDLADSSSYFEAPINGGYKIVMHIDSEVSKSDIQHFQRVALLGELLNTLQHELSNPLFGIQLATEFLKSNPNNDECKESLSEISEYCKRCQDILRDFKFLYQGGDKFLDVSIKKLTKETLTLTKSASRGIKKELIFDTDFDVINTNPTWLSQILFNLILNSAQAIHSTGRETGLITIEVKKPGKELTIVVSDNGPGIESVNENSVFDPFYTTKEKGTGLGLSICQNLAEKLGGSLSLSDDQSGGASFSLTLPISGSLGE